MEEKGIKPACSLIASGSVRNEVICFFRANPFLLVSEGRLASLLCRPLDMVSKAVGDLEAAGMLARRYGGALLGVEETLALADADLRDIS